MHVMTREQEGFSLLPTPCNNVDFSKLTLYPTVFSLQNWLLMTWSMCTCAALWVKNWLDFWAPRVKVNGIQSCWQLVASGISWGLALRPVCFTFLSRFLNLQMMSTLADTLTCLKIGRFSRGIWIDKYDGPNPVTWHSTRLSVRCYAWVITNPCYIMQVT